MIAPAPKRPTGSTPEARFSQWVYDSLISMRPMGPDVSRTTRGTFQHPGASVGGAARVGRYRLKSVQGDYITCRGWDGTTEGTTDIYIAKDPKHRNSLLTEAKPDGAHTYEYGAGSNADNVKRTDTCGLTSEQQEIAPPWCVNDEIYALTCNTGVNDATGNPIYLLAISPARQWAEI